MELEVGKVYRGTFATELVYLGIVSIQKESEAGKFSIQLFGFVGSLFQSSFGDFCASLAIQEPDSFLEFLGLIRQNLFQKLRYDIDDNSTRRSASLN